MVNLLLPYYITPIVDKANNVVDGEYQPKIYHIQIIISFRRLCSEMYNLSYFDIRSVYLCIYVNRTILNPIYKVSLSRHKG